MKFARYIPIKGWKSADEIDRRILAVELRQPQVESSGSPGGVSDHGALSGLGDDDHSQYHTDARGDARYSQLGHTHPYDAAGTAAAAVAAHEAAVDPHPQYITWAYLDGGAAASAFTALGAVDGGGA